MIWATWFLLTWFDPTANVHGKTACVYTSKAEAQRNVALSHRVWPEMRYRIKKCKPNKQ